MIKKELLSLPKLNATDRMMQLVTEDKLEKEVVYGWSGKYTRCKYARYQYYRAAVHGDILKVAVFSRKHMAAGSREPEFEIFISKEEQKYLTLDKATGKWKTAKIDNLPYDLDNGRVYGNKPWASAETKRIVNEYLETGKLEVKEAILKFQSEILKEKLIKKRKNELESIDAVMNAVPELPKDFDEWVLKSAFIHERCIFYHAGTRNGWCTHCEQEVTLKEKPHHNTNGTCPNCKSKVLYKAWKKQKYVFAVKRVGIIQRLTDDTGFILRKFKCRTERTLEENWRLAFAGCWEEERYSMDKHFIYKEMFEWGEYKNTGINRWCHEINHGMFGGYYRQTDECILYHRNIRKLRKNTELKYIPVEILLKSKQGCYCEPLKMMRTFVRYPKVEYLIKAGLFQLTWDLFTHREYVNDLNWEAKKPWEVLEITKEQMQQCIRIDISQRELLTLQRANDCGVKLTDEQVHFFTKNVGPNLIRDIAVYGHMDKFKKYFTTELEGTREIGDYIDYLNDLRKLNIPIAKRELFPKNFQNVHQQVAMQRQEYEDKLADMEMKKKNQVLKKMLPKLKEIYNGEDDNFVIVLPTCKSDFNKEGRENHNCVGGSYFDKMLRGDSVVMFLRRKEDPTKAFCTVEMKDDRILQCRAVCNRTAPQDAQAFMEKFAKGVGKRLAEMNKKAKVS